MARQKILLIFALVFVVFGLFYFFQNKKNAVSPSAQVAPAPQSTPAREAAAENKSKVAQQPSVAAIETVPLRGQGEHPLPVATTKKLNTDEMKLESLSLLAETPWKLWRGVRAFDKSKGAFQGKVIGEVGGYLLIAEDSDSGSPTFSVDAPWVVYDSRLNKAGIVTGQFAVILKEGTQPDFLSQLEGVKVTSAFPNIRTYYVTATDSTFDLQSFYNELSSQAGVENIKLEIMSRDYEKY